MILSQTRCASIISYSSGLVIMIHPQLDDLIFMTKNLGGLVEYLRVNGNGILLDPKRTKRLLDATCLPNSPTAVVFTIDAFSPQVYPIPRPR